MEKIKKPTIAIIYEGVDITQNVYSYLLNLSYTDKIDADSPDLDIDLEDSKRLWQSDWFPTGKDKIDLKMFYEDDSNVLEAGWFEVDEVSFEFNNGGDRIKIGAQQTPLSKNLRQKQSFEYEKVTLAQVVDQIATRQGLTVEGKIFDITFDRLTQNEESDLEFLTRISTDYGQLFKIEGDRLIFYNWSDLNAQPPEFLLDRKIIARFSAKKKLVGTYKGVQLTYEKEDDTKTVDVYFPAETEVDSEDILTISERSESDNQGEYKAKEQLRKANADEYSGSITVEGSNKYLAGLNFSVEGFGKFDGVWQVQTAKHNFSKNQGWVCTLDINRVKGKS